MQCELEGGRRSGEQWEERPARVGGDEALVASLERGARERIRDDRDTAGSSPDSIYPHTAVGVGVDVVPDAGVVGVWLAAAAAAAAAAISLAFCFA